MKRLRHDVMPNKDLDLARLNLNYPAVDLDCLVDKASFQLIPLPILFNIYFEWNSSINLLPSGKKIQVKLEPVHELIHRLYCCVSKVFYHTC